jgi:hypothetical protein
MRGVAVLLALVVALAAAACGGGSEPAAEQAPQDAVVLAASKTNEAGTYKADITGTVDVAGQSMDMSGSGAFDAANKQGRMSYTMNVAGQVIDMEMVFAFPVVYMHFPPEIGPLPGGKTWVKIDLEKMGQQAGVDFGQLMQAGQNDPSQGLDFLRGVSDVQTVGDEDVRGVATTHYTGVVDLQSLGAKSPELKAQVDQLVERSGISRVPIEVWIDDEGFVRRMKQSFEGNGTLPMNMTMTTEFYDFGTDVSVEEPPADDVVDFSDLMGQS